MMLSLILPMSQLQTQQLMTSQIRSHIEYLIQIYNILCAHFILKIDEKCSRTGRLAVLMRFNDDS